MENVKFMYNGIKVDGKLIKGYWSKSDDAISFYADGYGSQIPRELFDVENETDSMTDYFDKDSTRIFPADQFYTEALAAWEKDQIRSLKRHIGRLEKQIEKLPEHKKSWYKKDLAETKNKLAQFEN